MILRLHARRCSNLLDKIYGILALIPEPYARVLQPNYDLTHNELYTNLTITWIRLTRSLYVLSCVDRITSRSSNMPSYVLDLSTEQADPNERIWLNLRLDVLLHFNASKNVDEATTALPSLQLSIKAIFVDTVLKTETVETCEWIIGMPYTDYVSPESVLKRYATPSRAFWETICGGVMLRYREILKRITFQLLQGSEYSTDWARYVPANFELSMVAAVRKTAEIMQLGRRFATTSSGYIGLIPEAAEPGDHVVVMPGGKVPYIIRQLEGAYGHHTADGFSTLTERYEFIGDCHIHGIMFGEAWDETKLQPIVLA